MGLDYFSLLKGIIVDTWRFDFSLKMSDWCEFTNTFKTNIDKLMSYDFQLNILNDF